MYAGKSQEWFGLQSIRNKGVNPGEEVVVGPNEASSWVRHEVEVEVEFGF